MEVILTTAHLAAYVALLECMLASVLLLRMALKTPELHSSQTTKVRHKEILAARILACLTALGFVVANGFNDENLASDLCFGVAATCFGIYVALEPWAAWKTFFIRKSHPRSFLFLFMGHVLAMEAWAYLALFGWSSLALSTARTEDVIQTQFSWTLFMC